MYQSLIREETTVIDFVTKNNGDILPIVQLNETTETREIEPLHYPARVHTGDTVQVYYVYPNSDDRLWIDSFWELWLRPVALLITGSAGVIVSSMLFIFGKKK